MKISTDRIKNLEDTAQTASARGTSANADNTRLEREILGLKKKGQIQNKELENLRSELHDAQRVNGSNKMNAGQTYPARPGGGIDGPSTNAEIKRLSDENDKLRQELAAFDMDFFEEIENLKYSHAEATKKLRAYEAASGGAAGASGSRRGY